MFLSFRYSEPQWILGDIRNSSNMRSLQPKLENMYKGTMLNNELNRLAIVSKLLFSVGAHLVGQDLISGGSYRTSTESIGDETNR